MSGHASRANLRRALIAIIGGQVRVIDQGNNIAGAVARVLVTIA
jgi:hypothetical protein